MSDRPDDNNRPDDNDWLETMLQQPAKHIDDDGFTARVVSRLPAKSSSRQRVFVLGLCTALAGLVLVLLPAGQDVAMAFDSLVHWRQQGPVMPIVGMVLVGLLAWGAWGLATAEDV